MEEFARAGATSISSGFGLQDDIAIPYITDLGTDEQKSRWLPKMASGECIGAIAMTEPSGGSDLAALRTSAVRDGSEWVINGSKTFITNAMSADLVLVAGSKNSSNSVRLVETCERAGTPAYLIDGAAGS